jgi:hypothetical protein
MKKITFALFICTILFNQVQAQKFHIGAKAGVNINKLTGQSFSNQFSYGYQLGGFAEIGLGKKFSIQPEVLFSSLSTDTTDRFSDIYNNILSSNRSAIKLKYLSIPILLDYKLSRNISLHAGPQFGIIIDQNKNLLQTGNAAFKSGDFSLVGGIQLRLSRFRVYGRYTVGLNDLNDIDNQDQWKSQTIQFGVGLAIL